MVRAEKRTSAQKLPVRLLKPLLGPLVLAVAIFYFSFHALSGERGLYALLKEDRKLELLKGELDDVTAKRKDLEHRVRLMSDGSLDLDLLDEQSRILLNDAAEDEVVVPINRPMVPDAPHAN
jgi:cell division protein FtsB